MLQTIDVSPEHSSLVDVQASGLDLFDLSVKATPLSISWNRDALESAVNAVIEQYEGLTVTADQIPAVKSEMAGLNKLKDKLLTAKREIVNSIKAPLDGFDREATAMIGKITATRTKLDEQIKAFEHNYRESRRLPIQIMIDAAKNKAGIMDFELPINEKWLNKTAKMSGVAAEIDNLCLKEQQKRAAAAQLERAKQDRISLVGATVQTQATRHGFDLPMGKFAHCMSLEMTGNEVTIYITKAFEAEAAMRERAAASAPDTVSATPSPPASVPTPALLPEQPVPVAPQPVRAPWDEDLESMSTPPTLESLETLTLSLSFSAANRKAVLEIVERLRAVAAVTIN